MRAVSAASANEPETDALEWKGPLDLRDKKARYDLARHVLGFGNRSITDASEAFEGFAYILIGVEPGSLCGVDVPDPATLTNALGRYVAHGQPAWRPLYAEVDGFSVLVIEVAAPKPGDRICTLRDTYDNSRAGRIFVRRHGQTEEASPDVVRGLEDRYAAPALEASQRAAELQEENNRLASQQLTMAQEREDRERDDRAAAEAPDFIAGRQSPGFVFTAPDTLQGEVRNVGGTAANLVDLRLQHPNGAAPGAAVPVYGSGPAGDFTLPVRIEKGVEGQLRFVHAALQVLSQYEGPLTIEMVFDSDAGLQWQQKLTLRRKGDQHPQGRRLWTVRHNESEIDRWH